MLTRIHHKQNPAALSYDRLLYGSISGPWEVLFGPLLGVPVASGQCLPPQEIHPPSFHSSLGCLRVAKHCGWLTPNPQAPSKGTNDLPGGTPKKPWQGTGGKWAGSRCQRAAKWAQLSRGQAKASTYILRSLLSPPLWQDPFETLSCSPPLLPPTSGILPGWVMLLLPVFII